MGASVKMFSKIKGWLERNWLGCFFRAYNDVHSTSLKNTMLVLCRKKSDKNKNLTKIGQLFYFLTFYADCISKLLILLEFLLVQHIVLSPAQYAHVAQPSVDATAPVSESLDISDNL